MFDSKLVFERVKEETNYDDYSIKMFCKSINNLHPALKYVIEAWLNREYINFEFEGITIKHIMQKEECTFIEAVYSMSAFLKHPELVDGFSNYEFGYDIVGDLPSEEE